MIRTQYHFRTSPRGLLAWNVRRLIQLSQSLPRLRVPVSAIAELEEDHWYKHGRVLPSCRSVVEHCQLILAADLAFPIILDANGRLMDGMHRVCKAVMQGTPHLLAVQFGTDPEPDFVGREPETLPYDEDDSGSGAR